MELPDLKEWVVYQTTRGVQLAGDSREVLRLLPDDSVNLVVTSPPFALLRQKTYGNQEQSKYVDWLMEFGREVQRVLRKDGSFVLDLGGAYQRGRPVRSLYNYRILLRFCDELGYRLAEEFFWFNPSKLPSPIEWVNKRKIRAKDAVNTIWWFCKEDFPRADVSNVLVPYSERMKKLLQNPEKFYRAKERPSGHDIGKSFGKSNGGAIPPNLLQIPNSESNSHYLKACKALGRKAHPARFPERLPRFFIEFLSDPGDLVLDIFSGSNTTGRVAEDAGRQWISIEIDRSFAALSGIRFMEEWPEEQMASAVRRMDDGEELDITAEAPVPARLTLPLD